MPWQPRRPCPRFGCPRLLAPGEHCPEHTPADRWATGARGYPVVSGWDWQRTRARILTRDGGRCYRCGGQAVTADHVCPRSLGGTDDDSNLAAICERCHRRKTQAEAALARRGAGGGGGAGGAGRAPGPPSSTPPAARRGGPRRRRRGPVR